jgi:hypothetical protein
MLAEWATASHVARAPQTIKPELPATTEPWNMSRPPLRPVSGD